MGKNKDFNPQFVVTWMQLQGYYQVETPFPKYNPGGILSNSEEEIVQKLLDWLHLNDKLRPPKRETPVDPRKYIEESKKKEGQKGRCSRCGKVEDIVLFNDEDKICYCIECVPCL